MPALTSSSRKVSTTVDAALAERAVKALLHHHKLELQAKTTEQKKTSLLGDDTAVQVQFTLEKIPERPSHKPIRVLIPHPLYKIDGSDDGSNDALEEPSVCLVVKEESKPWVQEMIGNFPKEMGFVKKVLGLQSLRKKHARYEQRRMLLSRYDVFMADDRILPMLAKSLGKEFFKAKKQPIPIALTRKHALPFVILQSLQATFLFISSGTTLTVRAATTAMSERQVLENVQAVIENAVPKIPGKWRNIRCVAIKTPTSMSLPFYNKTPEELALIAQLAGVNNDDDDDDEMKVAKIDIKAKKDAKKKLAAKSPLVQALRKLEQEAEEAPEKEEEKATKTSRSKKHKKKRSISVDIEIEESETVKKSKKNEEKKRSVSEEIELEENIALAPKDEMKQKDEMRSVSAKNETEDENVVKTIEKKRERKKKRSMSEELEVKKKVVEAESKKKTDFVASKTFKGSKKGYVFRAGARGVGYYVDVKPVVDKMAMEAFKRSAAHQTRGGGGRRKKGKKGRR